MPSEQRYVRLRLSTKAIKTLDRYGVESILTTLRAQGEKFCVGPFDRKWERWGVAGSAGIAEQPVAVQQGGGVLGGEAVTQLVQPRLVVEPAIHVLGPDIEFGEHPRELRLGVGQPVVSPGHGLGLGQAGADWLAWAG